MIKRILIWIGFFAVIGLIIWGLIVAEGKRATTGVGDTLPTEVVSTDWSIGSADAPVTIVEYSDFQCPACAAYNPVLKQLIDESAGKARLVYRHFPLPQHRYAILASKYAEAAGIQGKFWEMNDLIFSGQADWESVSDADEASAIFDGYAQSLSLDMTKLASDINNPETESKIIEQYRAGSRAGVNSTPTFFLNGKRIVNPRNIDEFKKLIEEATQ